MQLLRVRKKSEYKEVFFTSRGEILAQESTWLPFTTHSHQELLELFLPLPNLAREAHGNAPLQGTAEKELLIESGH